MSPHEIDETLKERQMKYLKIVKNLGQILFFIGKQILRNFLVIVWQVTHCYLLLYEHIQFTITKRLRI